MKLLGRKILFRSPAPSEIVIFERIGSERIKELIIPELPAFVFDSLLEEIYLSPKIIYNFISSLGQIEFRWFANAKKLARYFAWQLWNVYLLSCLKCFKPKVVVTLIDNHGAFHWLCAHYREAEFLAIQNGSRTKVEFRGLQSPYRIGHLFCFGKYEKDLYSQAGHRIDHYYPLGSLLAGYHRPKTRQGSNPPYDLCVVSGWRGNIGNGPDVQRTMTSMKKMDRLLGRYIAEYGLTAVVIMRSEPDSPDRNIPVYGNEKEYFRSLYPEHVRLIDPNFKERNIYQVMDQARIIVSSGSTAPREAFGWGKKVLYCDFTGTDLYNDYESAIMFKNDDYELFKQRLNEIRLMPDEEYRHKMGDYAAYLMNYDPEHPPHLFIRQKIGEFLQ